jgi:hypothetical protein
MGETVKDPWRRRQIDWEVGLGLLDALAAAQLRGDASDMLDNATLTAAYLERGGEQRELTDKERKNAGDLLFRIGIMHSLQRGDHATAVTWFDRVIPMWEGNPRLERDREAGQLGESYVSMAISYWQVDRRDDAMALSRRGVELMVAAVDSKKLEERSLAARRAFPLRQSARSCRGGRGDRGGASPPARRRRETPAPWDGGSARWAARSPAAASAG